MTLKIILFNILFVTVPIHPLKTWVDTYYIGNVGKLVYAFNYCCFAKEEEQRKQLAMFIKLLERIEAKSHLKDTIYIEVMLHNKRVKQEKPIYALGFDVFRPSGIKISITKIETERLKQQANLRLFISEKILREEALNTLLNYALRNKNYIKKEQRNVIFPNRIISFVYKNILTIDTLLIQKIMK